jgi:hydrogenase maturation protease
MARRIILCVGNRDRGDDGVGARVAALLRGREPAEAEVIECFGEATLLLEALEGASAAVIVDAALSGAPAGTVRRFDLNSEAAPLLGDAGVSSHGFGLAAAIGLARALGTLPNVCILFTVEAESFVAGAVLSAGARAGAKTAARSISAELESDFGRSAAPLSTDGESRRSCPQGRKTL